MDAPGISITEEQGVRAVVSGPHNGTDLFTARPDGTGKDTGARWPGFASVLSPVLLPMFLYLGFHGLAVCCICSLFS